MDAIENRMKEISEELKALTEQYNNALVELEQVQKISEELKEKIPQATSAKEVDDNGKMIMVLHYKLMQLNAEREERKNKVEKLHQEFAFLAMLMHG